MKRILMIFVITFILFINSNVYAICDTNDMNRLKEIAKNVEVSYEHNIYGSLEGENGMLASVYDITVSGLTDELYVVDDNGNKYYSTEFYEGLLKIETTFGKRKVYIHSRNCMNQLLESKTLNLPRFNFNSINEECQKEEFKDLDICAEFIENEDEVISSEEFKEEIKKEEKKNQSLLFKIKDFVIENIIFIIIGCVVLFGIIILLLVRHKKRSVLE